MDFAGRVLISIPGSKPEEFVRITLPRSDLSCHHCLIARAIVDSPFLITAFDFAFAFPLLPTQAGTATVGLVDRWAGLNLSPLANSAQTMRAVFAARATATTFLCRRAKRSRNH